MNNNLINFLLKLKNASMARKEFISITYNKLNKDLLCLLYKEGFIQSFNVNLSNQQIEIHLRYSYNKDIFKNLKIISTSSRFNYLKYSDICKLSNKRFIFIVSTSKGFFTGLECKKYHIGGKLCFTC
jgi:small subunit ribosomal protein S8